MKTLIVFFSSCVLLSTSLSAQHEGRSCAHQWVELHSTAYHFPDWQANSIAKGLEAYTLNDVLTTPIYFYYLGGAVSRLWLQERLIARIGYDRFFSVGVSNPKQSMYFSSRKYNFYTLEAGPVWTLGRMKRHMFTPMLGVIQRWGREGYILGFGQHSGGFGEPFGASRSAINDQGVCGKLEYHFSPIRYLRVGVSAQYQYYYRIRGELSSSWPAQAVPLREQWAWGLIIGAGF